MRIMNTGLYAIKLKNGYNIIAGVSHSDEDRTSLIKAAVIIADKDGKTSLVEYEPLAKDFEFDMCSENIEHASKITDAGDETYQKFVEELEKAHSSNE